MTPHEVADFIKQKGIKIVDLKFNDLPGLWQHFSIPVAEMTEMDDLTKSIWAEGIGFDEPMVLVYYRAQGERVYSSQRLEAKGPGRFEGSIPAAATMAPELKYYIEVIGPNQAYRTRVGAPDQPMSVMLLKPADEPGAGSALIGSGVVGVPLLLVGSAAGLLIRKRRRQRLTRHHQFVAGGKHRHAQLAPDFEPGHAHRGRMSLRRGR